MSKKVHWNNIYSTKKSGEMSWTQSSSKFSLQLISETNITKSSPIIDIGGGVSVLVDELLAQNFSNLTVLDISGIALNEGKNRLGPLAKNVKWMEADVIEACLPIGGYHLWHDRAVFHFLTEEDARKKYVAKLTNALVPGGFVIFATFSPEGPEKCSGLSVMRHNASSLKTELGDCYQLKKELKESHLTPWSSTQEFIYCLFQKQS